MITECAPMDALIQRFGRINRKRTSETIGTYKPVYILAPPDDPKDAKPYETETLTRSFNVIEDGMILKERSLQFKIDEVFQEINFMSIEEHSIFKSDSQYSIEKLTHHSKAILFELLDIDSVSCITESDIETYNKGDYETRLSLEIPVHYRTVAKLNQSEKGNRPFIIPDAAYDFETGLKTAKINEKFFNTFL